MHSLSLRYPSLPACQCSPHSLRVQHGFHPGQLFVHVSCIAQYKCSGCHKSASLDLCCMAFAPLLLPACLVLPSPPCVACVHHPHCARPPGPSAVLRLALACRLHHPAVDLWHRSPTASTLVYLTRWVR